MPDGNDESFEVRITISGLCMFVPDERRGVMHVLMPRMAGHGHPGAADAAGHEADDRHFVRLVYDAAQLRRGGAGTRCLQSVDLDRRVVRIGARAGLSAPELALDREFVPLLDDSLCFGRVDPACLGPGGHERVTSRVELHSGRATCYDSALPDEVCLEDDRGRVVRCQRMVENVEWTLGGFAGSVDLASLIDVAPIHESAGAAVAELPTLYPMDGVVRVDLLHVVRDVLPVECEYPEPQPGSLDHFLAYYQLADPAKMPCAALRMPRGFLFPTKRCTTSQARLS